MIVVATTLHAYVTDQADTSEAWLYNAEAIVESHPDGVQFFVAIELDGRGMKPFAPLLGRLARIRNGGKADFDYWTFSFDDHATEITTGNRLRRITIGQNMSNDYAMSVGATHLLFCAADCAPDGDVLPKLLEMDHPLVGPEITTYCLSGPEPMKRRIPKVGERVIVHRDGENPGVVTAVGGGRVSVTEDTGEKSWPVFNNCDADPMYEPVFPFPVQKHMASAACILLDRSVFRRLRWRSDGDMGMTDDPCLHHDVETLLGIPTYVRKDVFAKHYPESIGSIESRHPGDARRIHPPTEVQP